MTHAILRATGIVMLLGIAVIHVVQLVPTFRQTALLGVAYIMLIVAAVVRERSASAGRDERHASGRRNWRPES